MSSVKVVLDNYNSACYPGQTLAGRIECYFDEETSFRAIRIKFRGRAKTEWTESESYYDHHSKQHRTRSVTYSAHENYFDAEYNLVQGGDNIKLPGGNHSYPFSYILPPQLPSTYEGSYGNIRYYVQATVDRPWKFDFEDRLGLTVVSPLDLNYLPGIREPVAVSDDKTMCSCWCNDSGALTFNMSLPAAGFVPGQAVNVGCSVQNMTNVSVENIKFRIKADIEFITHYPSTHRRYDDYVVAGQVEGGVGAHGEKSWTAVLNIPANKPFPNLVPCNIMNITYRLKGEAVVPCPHTNLELEVPVMIGTVPLSGVATSFPAGPPPTMPLPMEGAPLLPPGAGMPSYPPPGGAPYPGDMNYPAGGLSPYPPAGGGAPYPPGGAGAPYPPNGGASYPPEKSPSAPPPAGAIYPTAGAPYPPGPSAPSANGAPYPSGTAPYPPGPSPSAGASYPPTSAPYPPPQVGWPGAEKSKDLSDFELPSYEDAKDMKEKK